MFADFTDAQGAPLRRRDQRQKILAGAWQKGLQTLSSADRFAGPSRIIAATGDQVEQMLALHGMLFELAAQGGSEFDTNNIEQFIDMDRLLGDTGAATLFMQIAIGAMGSGRREGLV